MPSTAGYYVVCPRPAPAVRDPGHEFHGRNCPAVPDRERIALTRADPDSDRFHTCANGLRREAPAQTMHAISRREAPWRAAALVGSHE